MAMIRVRFLTGVSYGAGPSYAPGDIGMLDEAEVARLLDAKYVEVIEEPKPEQAVADRGRRKAVKYE